MAHLWPTPLWSWHYNATAILHIVHSQYQNRHPDHFTEVKNYVSMMMASRHIWLKDPKYCALEGQERLHRQKQQAVKTKIAFIFSPTFLMDFLNNSITEADKLWLCMSICTYTFASKSAFLSILKLKSGFDHHNERVITLSDLCLTCCPPLGCWLALTVENN